MPKGIYSEEVTYEEIKFDDKLKAAVKEKKMVSGSDVRYSKGDSEADSYFYQQRTVGNQGQQVQEGQVIVSFPDGRQKLLSAEEFKNSVKKTKDSADGTSDDGPVVVVEKSDGTKQLLTQEQSKEILDEAADKTADKSAKNDAGKTNPATGAGKSSNTAK